MTTLPAEIGVGSLQDRTVIDVRTPGEYAAGHIPGSHNVPLDRITAALPALREAAGKGELAVVCATGSRSQNAAAKLAQAGISAPSVTGGTAAWSGELERSEGPAVRSVWPMDRQVRLTAGSLVLVGLLLNLAVPYAWLLSAAIGAGLVFSAVTNTCGMAAMLGRLPYNRPRGGDEELERTLELLRAS
ncbi:Inner membrane protein YgaP [Streptomyces sp. RB5]|uniref:Inner membrane protein YgaP n=1 Tax=Streptomyces smaragdinus TaxID=2585196 RepID=A0A7K0CB88_9ACTN|nr:rhodanese-like domain-containing protein [Streptomyces smaragdinus]MQY10705.1 Inner membrane protein YgaP [Streptomyces smaragdinus]